MSRRLQVITWSGAAFVFGFLVSFVVTNWYERTVYPPEPDPVHFDVGGVFGGTWVLMWLIGTAIAAWRVYRRS